MDFPSPLSLFFVLLAHLKPILPLRYEDSLAFPNKFSLSLSRERDTNSRIPTLTRLAKLPWELFSLHIILRELLARLTKSAGAIRRRLTCCLQLSRWCLIRYYRTIALCDITAALPVSEFAPQGIFLVRFLPCCIQVGASAISYILNKKKKIPKIIGPECE